MDRTEVEKYFKYNNGFNRFFETLRKMYVKNGGFKGNVIIPLANEQEKETMSGFLGKNYYNVCNIRANVKEIRKAISRSKFHEFELEQILEIYYGDKIVSNLDKKVVSEKNLEEFFRQALQQQVGKISYEILQQIFYKKDTEYFILKKYYKTSNNFFKELLGACEGINNLPSIKTKIPVFASNILANPHGLDKDTICGKIFIMFLAYMDNIEKPKNNEGIVALYYNHNLLIDDVSNMVLCKNLLGYVQDIDGSMALHEGWEGFTKNEEAFYVTLHNLSKIEKVSTIGEEKNIFVTENPSVFMEVSQRCNNENLPLVCTYGQVKLSCILLLDLLVKEGYKLIYSGDMDPEGMQIADKLKLRYGNSLELIGFDKKTYYNNISEVNLPQTRLKQLDSIIDARLREVAEEVKICRKATYEEMNIPQIIEFLNLM